VDLARMPVYAVVQGKEVLGIWPVLLLAIIGVVMGTLAGERVLRKIPEPLFRRIVSLIILTLGVALFLYPGKG
jgi:uncharacterized membrane protein YfcA